MTSTFCPDLSNHDRTRLGHAIPVQSIRRAGAVGITCKLSEGTWTDPFFTETFNQIRTATPAFAFAGPYHVLWPAQGGQAAFVWQRIHDLCPWLLNPPAGLVPIMMGDFEIFAEFDPNRAPTLAECHQFLDEFKALSGWRTNQLWAYMPEWLYGMDTIRRLRYPWIASTYGANPCGDYRAIYPGDASSRWTGIELGLQYGSCATYDGLRACDTNASLLPVPALKTFLLGGADMSQADVDAINAHTDQMLRLLWSALGGQDNSVFAGGTTAKDSQAAIFQRLDFLWKAVSGTDNSVYSGGTSAADVARQVTALQLAVEQLPDQVADAVIAKTGSGVGGQVTKADVVDAVRSVIAGTFLTPPAPPPT